MLKHRTSPKRRPVVHQAPLIPPLTPVKGPTTSRIIIEVEHGAVEAVYSSDPGVKIEILDRDGIAIGNIRPADSAPLETAIKDMHQVY